MKLETITGNLLNLDNPAYINLDIRDIVEGLSRIKRFNGRSSLNVLQHSYATYLYTLEKRYVYGPDFPIGVLLHDAGEAFIGDIISPIKQLCPEVTTLEYTLRALAHQSAGVESYYSDHIRTKIDTLAMQVEYKYYVAHDAEESNQYIYGIETDLTDSDAQLMAKCLLEASLMDEEKLILTVSNILLTYAATYYRHFVYLTPGASNKVLFTANGPFICTLHGWFSLCAHARVYLCKHKDKELIILGQTLDNLEETRAKYDEINFEVLSGDDTPYGQLYKVRLTYNPNYELPIPEEMFNIGGGELK